MPRREKYVPKHRGGPVDPAAKETRTHHATPVVPAATRDLRNRHDASADPVTAVTAVEPAPARPAAPRHEPPRPAPRVERVTPRPAAPRPAAHWPAAHRPEPRRPDARFERANDAERTAELKLPADFEHTAKFDRLANVERPAQPERPAQAARKAVPERPARAARKAVPERPAKAARKPEPVRAAKAEVSAPAAAHKHRAEPAEPALAKGIRKSVVFSGVAVAATGVAVSSGIVVKGGAPADAAASLASARASNHNDTHSRQVDASPVIKQSTNNQRGDEVSRSAMRSAIDPTKKAALKQESGGQLSRTEDVPTQDPRSIARAMLPQFGFSSSEFSCLDALWNSESGWDVHADNPTSSAFGIPQALPGSKMASAGPDWQDNPATQIRWGLGYIRDSYGTPCSAWAFKQSHNWY